MPAPGRWPLRVWVDTDQVLVSSVELPGRHWNRLRQALPFALEDRLVQDVDRYHVALGQALGNGAYLCASVDQRQMTAWQELLSRFELKPDALAPLCLALPAPPDGSEANVIVDGPVAYLRCRDLACRIGSSELSLLLTRQAGLSRVNVAGEVDLDLPTSIETARLSVDNWPDAALTTAEDLPLNLMQGEFASRSDGAEAAARLWRRAAAVFLLAGALALVDQFLKLRSTQNDLMALKTQAASVVASAIPDAPAEAAPRPTLDRALAGLKGTAGIDDDGFMYLLGIVGPAIAQRSGLELEALEFRSDGMLLNLNSTSLDEVESLRQQIDQASAVAVRLESQQTVADGGTRVQLRVGGTP